MAKLVTFILLFLIVNPAMSAVPAWMSSGIIAEYSDHQRYIVAIAEAKSLLVAEKLAFAKLAEQIKVDITGQSLITKGFSSKGNQTTEYESIDVNVLSRVSLTDVGGIQIVARHLDTDTNQHYVFAILDKVKASSTLTFQLDDLFRQVDAVRAESKRLVQSDNPSKGFRALAKISVLFKSIQSDLVMHQLFATTDMKESQSKRYLSRVRSHDQYLSAVFSDVHVVVENDDIQPGSAGLGAEEPFDLSFAYLSQPLKFVPVRVGVEDDGYQFEVDRMTDRNGKLSVKVQSMPYTGNEVNRINVALAVSSTIFNAIPPSAELTIMLNQKSDTTVGLSARFSDPNYSNLATIIENTVTELLSEHNYNMSKLGGDAEHDYNLSIQTRVTQYPGYGELKFVKIGGVVEIKSSQTNQLLKVIHIQSDATKAGGLSAYEAAEKSAALVADALRKELLDVLESVIGR